MATPLRVLILEDRPADARLVMHELKQAGFECDWKLAEDESSFASHLDPPPDVIVADYSLPQYDALRALRLMRARELDIPFLIVSGSIGEDTAVAAMREGAADYLLKDRLARLGEAVRLALEQQRLRNEKRQVEEALRQSEQSLKEANRRKDEFLAMLAHELRNPLAPVRNGLQVLKFSTRMDGTVQQLVGMMERQVQHMVRLIDDLLDVSRITRGKITLHKEPVPLATVVARAVEASRPLIDARHHTLQVSMPRETLTVSADSTRLAQVFTNLLNNAAKFSEEHGRIRLVVEREGNEAVIRVGDNGAGIRPDLLPQVFDLFVQGDQTLDRTQGGLGIGLTLVKSLVEMHDGTAQAASDGPGTGSEFIVRLPLHRAAQPSAEQGPPEDAGARPSASRRVLVVDDNRDSADSLAMLLKLHGNDVRTAYDGPSALEAVPAYRPDLIFLDIGLPRMNGYEVGRRVRGLPQFKDVPLIALTGYGSEGDRRRSEENGFDFHLVKPVDLVALQDLLAKLHPLSPSPLRGGEGLG
jgi:signal transduction histidine kinase